MGNSPVSFNNSNTWEEIKEQLERYGQAPWPTLLPLLQKVEQLNDDIVHSRGPTCIKKQIEACRLELDKLEEEYKNVV